VVVLPGVSPTAVVVAWLPQEHKQTVNQKDTQGMSALMFVCQNTCDVNIVRALVRAKADVNAEDQEGLTPLIYACSGVSEAVGSELRGC
jgi:ankyrin repeat protein